MSIDFEAICEALADRFEPAAIGTPSGAPAMRMAFAQVPKNVSVVPCVLLEVSDGSVIMSTGTWNHQMNIDVLFLLSKRPSDPDRVESNRQRWLPYLLKATQGQFKLGLGAATGYSVNKAYPTTWSWDEYLVGGDTYDAIRVRYVVDVTETVTLVP